MKGWAVFFMIVLVSVISVIIALSILVSNANSNIAEKEQLTRDSLMALLEAYEVQDTDSIEFFDSALYVPYVSKNPIVSFNSNYSELSTINQDISLIDRPVTFQKYQYLRSEIDNNINEIMRTANYYTTIRTNERFANAEIKLRESRKDVHQLISAYNVNVAAYNRLVSNQPVSIIAAINQKVALLRFETGENVKRPSGLSIE